MRILRCSECRYLFGFAFMNQGTNVLHVTEAALVGRHKNSADEVCFKKPGG